MLNSRRLPGLALLVTLVPLLGACEASGSQGVISVVGYEREVVADDGYMLRAFDLHLEGQPRFAPPRAWLFYLVGSEPVSVVGSMEQFAEIIARGFVVVIVQPRGVTRRGLDLQVFRQYETRQHRVSDQIAVIDAYLEQGSDIPVLLVGSSLGGMVAAEVAALEPRVTHLFMMASGGGWTFAEELTWLVEHGDHALASNVEELNATLDEIRANPDSDTLWAGHPYRMWSSYLWFRSIDSLAALSIPMFLAQGTEDKSTPVESARALRDEFERRGLANLTYVEYPGLDHHFANGAGENRLSDLQEDASAWMVATGLVDEH